MRVLTPGYRWEIIPLTLGRARIIVTDGANVERGY